jgi:AcrR family transcriptional regulator
MIEASAVPGDGRRRYVERARAGMREAILAAVEHLVRDRGWQATRMADIAAHAGVSRPTVYQLFGSREALAQAYVLREADAFLDDVSEAIRAVPADPLAAVGAGIEAFLTGAADNSMVKAILSGVDNDGLLPLVTTSGLPVIDFATQRLSTVIEELWPDLLADDVRVFVESAVRLAISHATVVGSAPERAVEDMTHLLGPFVTQAFARSGG